MKKLCRAFTVFSFLVLCAMLSIGGMMTAESQIRKNGFGDDRPVIDIVRNEDREVLLHVDALGLRNNIPLPLFSKLVISFEENTRCK